MVIATHISHFLRRRSCPVFTAFCDGALAFSLAVAIFPVHPWSGMLAAVLATIPAWLNIARERRCEKHVFAPDPLAPDFKAFAKSFLDSAAQCGADGVPRKWTLCPYCEGDGAFVAYRLDFRPAKAELAIGAESLLHCEKTDFVFRPRLPLPVEVRERPMTLVLSHAGTPRQIFIAPGRQFALPWNRREGNWLRDDIAKLWPSLALSIEVAFPDSAIAAPERLVVAVIALVFATFELARRRG